MRRNFTPKTGLAILAMFSILFNTSVSATGRRGDAKIVTKADQTVKALSTHRNSPFTEDFEGETFPPAGWTTYSLLDNQVNWSLGEWQNNTPGGTQSAYHNYTEGENSLDNWLVTPQITVPATGFHYLSFWSFLGNGWAYKKSSVLVSTTSPDPANGGFVEKWAGISNDGWIWAHFFIDLEEYVGQNIYIAFRYEVDTYGHTWNVDDVALVDNSPVATINVDSIAQIVAINGAGQKTFEMGNQGIQDLTFDIEIEYLNSTGWLTVNPVSGSVTSQGTTEITLDFNATGLETGTYQANLNISGNDPANMPITVGVTLQVVDVNVYPFVESFDSEAFPPIGWTKYDVDADGTDWALSWYNNTPGGQYSAVHSYSWTAQDGWFVTPQITMPAEGFFYLSFWSLVVDAEYYGKNSVLVSTGSGNPANGDFVEVWTVATVNGDWTQYYINLEQFAGQDIYIALRYEGEYAHTWVVDDFSLGEEVDDSPVISLSTLEISQVTGLDGTGTKSFRINNDGIQNLTYDIAIQYDNGSNWIATTPVSGSIPAKSSNTISLNFNAAGLELGTYNATLAISSNDEQNPEVTLVATLTVMEAQQVSLTVIYPEYTYPTAISADGLHVSGSQFGGQSSYLWSRFGATHDFAGEAMGVTDNGVAIGTYNTGFMFEGLEVSTAGTWNQNAQEWQFLGMNPDVPDFFGTFYNSAYGVTPDGNTIVGMQWFPDFSVRAVKWSQSSGYESIGETTEYNTRANGISDNGNVIYGWAEPNWTRTPVIWHNNQTIFIDQTQYGEALAASADGNYVTGSIGAQGFIWSATEGISFIQNTLNLGSLSPTCILNDGTLFGYINDGFPPTPDLRRAFVRYPDGTMETFNDYVQGRGWFDAADWTFFSINDVTADGNKFIGAAELPTGAWISFLLDFEPGNPVIEVSPLSLSETMGSGETSTQTIEIANANDGYLTYSAMVQYTASEPKVRQVAVGEEYKSGMLELGKTKITGNKANRATKSSKNTTLHYDGDNADAIGLTNGGTFYGAARFPSEMVAIFEGYQLASVDVFVGNVPTTLKLMVWGAGTTTTVGTLLHEQTFVPSESSWNRVTLSTPLDIAGTDIWVGFEITHDAGLYVLGMDADPTVLDGNWLSTNATEWEHLSDYGLNGNWNIRANLSFNGMDWLSLAPATGVLEEAQSASVNASFNASGMQMGTYTANVRISSNDTENPLIIIPVTLVVDSNSLVESGNAFTLAVFPNPANSVVTIASNDNIEKFALIDMLGQTIVSSVTHTQKVVFDVSRFNGGIYLLQVTTKHGTQTHRIQISY